MHSYVASHHRSRRTPCVQPSEPSPSPSLTKCRVRGVGPAKAFSSSRSMHACRVARRLCILSCGHPRVKQNSSFRGNPRVGVLIASVGIQQVQIAVLPSCRRAIIAISCNEVHTLFRPFVLSNESNRIGCELVPRFDAIVPCPSIRPVVRSSTRTGVGVVIGRDNTSAARRSDASMSLKVSRTGFDKDIGFLVFHRLLVPPGNP